ncbi:MAG: MFS transporter [Firmicutes bacterium]|nr:MFS transporter [Bacillota bacterium]
MKNWKKKIGMFLTSQAISLFGSSLVQYAIIWYITLKTGSGMMMTIATLCAFIPQVFISLFAGVWADRYPKKTIIILADALIALSTLIIAICFFAGFDSIWLLFLVLAIRSLGSGIQMPTVTAFIPEVVPENQLMRVNGINTTIQSIMLIVSPAVSGALLANVSLQYILLVDVVTAIIGITIFSFVKITHIKKEKVEAKYFDAIKEGIVYTKNHKFISRMIRYMLISNILFAPLSILTPLLITRSFGTNPMFLTLNEVVFFVGNIIGGIIISTWGGFKNRINTIGVGCFICGIFAIFLGIPINFIVYLLWMGLIGVMMPFINTPFTTIFQEEVDADKQGRVFSLISIISGAVMPLSMIVYGPLADYIRIEYILVVTGVLFLFCTVILWKDKVLRQSLVKK